ncbi:MAG: hypothetical protein ACLR4Z_07795 [Butyricicoccaceae bacterium]
MNGMIGGQVLDMGAEHRRISLDELRLLQKLKTGCLHRAACELGCAAAGATDAGHPGSGARLRRKAGSGVPD